MRASDIVSAFKNKLPSLVDDFTSSKVISTIVNNGYALGVTTFTVTTSSAHGLSNGKAAYIKGLASPIVVSSFTRVGVLGTITTATPHDLTLGSQDTVTTSGATEAEFNDTFTVSSIPDRYRIKVVMADSGATTATGSPVVQNASNLYANANGLRTIITTPSATTFTFTVPYNIAATPIVTASASVKSEPRITAAVDIENFITSHYTKQVSESAWLCVVLGDGIANKSKRQTIDATDNIQRANYFNQKVVQSLDVFVILPSVTSESGRSVRDRCEELLKPICQCILFKKVDGLTTAGLFNPLQLLGHGMHMYSTAFYVHRYSFELTVQLQFEDTAGFDDDVAFRDIDLTIADDIGTGTITNAINLDDEI